MRTRLTHAEREVLDYLAAEANRFTLQLAYEYGRICGESMFQQYLAEMERLSARN